MELQKIFRAHYVEELRQGVKDNSRLKYYEGDTFLYDPDKVLHSPLIPEPINFELLLPTEKENFDFENSKLLYEAYKSLTPLQASDVRLWTYLAHADCYPYMCKRWSGIQKKSSSNPSKYILDHWFISSPTQSNLLRHGISGLWWAAYLTYDDTRTDKYELTNVLYTQLDFATRTLGTYSLARHKEAVFGILEYIQQNPESFKNRFEAKSRFITRYINQVGGTKPISYFKRDFFKNSLHDIKTKIEAV